VFAKAVYVNDYVNDYDYIYVKVNVNNYTTQSCSKRDLAG
jgi:hypothetical protein